MAFSIGQSRSSLLIRRILKLSYISFDRTKCVCNPSIRRLFDKKKLLPPLFDTTRYMSFAPTDRKNDEERQERGNMTGIYYIAAIGVFMVGMSYAGVPLYRLFCQVNLLYIFDGIVSNDVS